MKRSRVCWLLVVAVAAVTGGAHGAAHATGAPRALQEATEVPAQVVANATDAPSASSAADNEDRAATTSTPNAADGSETTSAPSTEPDDRLVISGSGYRRSSALSTAGIVGIAVGGVAVVAIAIAFVRAGSSKRRQEQVNQHDELMAPQDLGSSTMSVKSAKYVESFDSSTAGTPRTSIAVIRKPSPPLRSQALGSSMHNNINGSSSSNNGANGSTTVAASSLSQSSFSAAAARRATMKDMEEFNPSCTVRTFSKSQRSASGHKAPLSPESYLKFAQSNSKNSFHQSRRVSRHSRAAMESPGLTSALSSSSFSASSSAFSSASSPAVRKQSRLRFSRRSSVHHETAGGGDDNTADIPMLGGGGAMNGLEDSSSSVHHQHNHQHHDPHSDSSDDESPTSPRDIPVLARGSEESVDSVEDDDVEISI